MAGDDDSKRHGPRRLILVAAGGLLLAVVLALGGILIRAHDESALAHQTDAAAVPAVAVIRPQRNAQRQTLLLPGDVEAWYLAPIYGQVSGYLRMWYKDIGAQVTRGELLAEINTPDLDQQLGRARADLAETQANAKLAEVTADRWRALLPTHSVSQQSVDVAVSDAAAKQSVVSAAEAHVRQLEALEGFKRLVAPFDGVVTARRTDVGALIKADSLPGPELFAVADIHAMRVYVRVPQSYAAQVHVGMTAELHLPDYPDRVFTGQVTTTAHAINPESRTLLVELQAPNPDGILSPGSFANVNFDLPADPKALVLPTSALMFQEHGMQVAIVDAHNKVVLKQIKIGRDLGTEMEVIGGLDASDQVIDDPPDSITAGEPVRVASRRGAPPGGGDANQATEPAQ